MATCNFCRQEFGSTQAVRAHLKACPAYRNRPPRQTPEAGCLREPSVRDDSLGTLSLGKLPTNSNTEPVSESDLVRQLAQRIAAERMRLQLRELEEAHGELDRRTEARELERESEAAKQVELQSAANRDREAARLRDANAKEARENSAHAEQRKHARRREIIQDIKREVVDNWLPVLLVSSELRAEIILEIERALTPLSVEELPRTELIDIAVAVRKRLYGKAEQAERRIRDQENQQAERRTRL